MLKTNQLQVAIYQYQARSENPGQRLQRLEGALRQLGISGADLLVCPELFLSGYNVGNRIADWSEPSSGLFAGKVAELAKRWQTAILYGYPEEEGGNRYNAAQCIGKDGGRLANHRKLALPGKFEKKWFSTGSNLTLFELHGWKIAVLICYDAEFPEAARACAQNGADLIVVPTALKDNWGVVAHRVIPARAFENGLFLIYANYAGQEGDWRYLGNSCVVSPTGEDIVRGSENEQVLTATLDCQQIQKAREILPYLDDLAKLPE
ncbi:MAG: carbon-nitrogen hydrolase family protein [SAR324 cluster bacterium]|nr:carbon-nitrogen hydrolase family protein [SAR324 cluster bacterium]